MLAMVLDGTFHKAYERGLLANNLQSFFKFYLLLGFVHSTLIINS